MSVKLVSFSHVAGAAIHYARDPVAEYGTMGKGPRTVRSTGKLRDTLAAALTDLGEVCPYGRPSVLVEAGFTVVKPGPHGEGQAVDIDSIWWPQDRELVTLQAPDDARRYLATEAILRQRFGTVLGYWYNRRHRDHWHCDITRWPHWRRASRMLTTFVQASLAHVLGRTVAIDGMYGHQTHDAVASIMRELDGPDDLEGGWLQFLRCVALTGWGRVEAG